jgi:hypothetical protein
MADLIYEFGADVTQFNASIADVTKEIKKLKDVLKTATGAEIPKLNAEIAALQTSLKNLKSVGTPAATAFAKVEDSAKGARIALTNVSQIAQDLPFGFIGIQNNIPGLVQSFGKLAGESGGAVAALKAMGSALIGPAGIFLAFSVATAAVTGLISKYGSLGAALDALIGKTNLLAKAQKDYNKELSQSVGSTATESLEIGILTKTLLDLNKPLKDRQAAYVELKKISPDVLAGISAESIATGKYTDLLLGNVTAIQSLIFLKAKEAALTTLINKNVAEQTALELERPALIAKLTAAQNAYSAARKKGFDATKTFGTIIDQEALALQSAKEAYGANVKAFNNLIPAYKEFEKTLIPTVNGIAAIDLRTKDLTDSLKEQDKVVKSTKKEKTSKGRAGLFDYLVTEVDKSLIPISKLQGKLDNLLKPKISPFRLEKPTRNPLQAQLDALKEFVLKSEEAKNQLKDFFFDPVNALFTNFFETGKFTIQAFGDVLLAQIKKIVAAELTKKLLSLLANLIPGIGAGSAALKAGSAIGSFLGAGGSLLGRGAANFSGVQGGGMGMSGSVNLTLRGTDLVGAINRTNTQISRVG